MVLAHGHAGKRGNGTAKLATPNSRVAIYSIVPWKKGNRLRTVSEHAADEATKAIFLEIQQALGVPVLRLFYPALAVYPQFLQLHWKMLKPVASSAELFACANRLRADAYTQAHNYLRIPDLCASLESRFSAAARQELTAAVDLFHYQNPVLLLLFSMQLQALEGPVGKTQPATPAAAHPVDSEQPVFVEEENSPSAVRRRFEEIRRVLELPYVNAEYEAMARFPDFLNVYWEYLKNEVHSPIYQECQYGIRETAWNLARELPGPLELSIEQLTEAGMKEEDIASVARILDLFVKNLSGLVLNIAIAKIALEGGNLANRTQSSANGDSEQVA